MAQECWDFSKLAIAIVGKAPPNICELVEVIKKEEALTTMRVQQLVAGASQPPRRRRVRDRDKKNSLSDIRGRNNHIR